MNDTENKLRVGLIAVKNTPEEELWLLSFLQGVEAESYRRGCRYDLVWFLNVTPELRFIKKHTDIQTLVVGMEPEFMYPLNYDADLLSFADRYMGYRNFASETFRGKFEPYTFPIYPKAEIVKQVSLSKESPRDHDFCLFATHDPNVRKALGIEAGRYKSILAGPFFKNWIPDKPDVQRRCRYELITENDINEYYFSEKLGAALTAGCVPVYWGCQRIKKKIPSDLFIDMSDFAGADGVPDVGKVIEHCMTPGIYEKYFSAIKSKAQDFLIERFSIETCLTDPMQRFIDELNASGWRAEKYSLIWTLWRWRSKLFRLLKKA